MHVAVSSLQSILLMSEAICMQKKFLADLEPVAGLEGRNGRARPPPPPNFDRLHFLHPILYQNAEK